MAKQADIARVLGVTQSTVSRALRGDRSISADLRRKVQETAAGLGYNPKNYLSLLMSSIRSGRKLIERGTIALLVEARSRAERDAVEAYRVFYQGAMKRGDELGFHIDSIFLQAPGMTADKVDRILHARGINGIILPPPYHSNRRLDLPWEHYAAVGVGFGWEEQDLDRVVYDDFRNYLAAFHELQRLGYRRIGTVLSKQFVYGHRGGNQWYPAYLDCQSTIPKNRRIPVFSGSTPMNASEYTAEMELKLPGEFRSWLLNWNPDVLITLVGNEKKWIDAMGLKVPQDIGVVCLAQTADGKFAGIDEKGEIIGETAVETVAAKIVRNEFGIPANPKIIMVQGNWIIGPTVQYPFPDP